MADRVRPVHPLVADIRRRREEAGWSLAELARRSGVSKGQLSEIENGVSGTSLYTLQRLAGALDLQVCLRPVRPGREVAHG